MNLRGLIPGIIEVLGVRSMSWQNTIVVARTFAEGKYAYEQDNDGRDDAGEFLGDILYHCRGYSWTLRQSTKLCAVCEGMEAEVNEPHSWANDIQLPMIILNLPPVESHTAVLTMAELVALETASQFQRDIQCSICEGSRQSGVITKSFVGVPPNVFAIRILRFTQTAKRLDMVYPNPYLSISEVDYSLRAIVLHQGRGLHSGHYIMYLRTATGWERRDDSNCEPAGNDELPYGMKKNNGIGKREWTEVVVVVYKRHAALSVAEALAAEQARANAIRERLKDEERERQQRVDEIRRREEEHRRAELRRKDEEARQEKLRCKRECVRMKEEEERSRRLAVAARAVMTEKEEEGQRQQKKLKTEGTTLKLNLKYACACCPAKGIGKEMRKRKAEDDVEVVGKVREDASAQQERKS